jgi:hypothetical protein
MICTTVREGDNCVFMTAKGCSYNEGACLPVIEDCDGCQKIAQFPTGTYCLSVPDPSLKWKNGICNMASHAKVSGKVDKHKLNPIKASKKLNPIKASKRK